MNKIFLIRHSISIGNEKNIIQGDIDYDISEIGKKLLEKLKCENLKHVHKIYSSPYLRAIRTSKYIKRKINFRKEIIIDNDLIEKNAGILNGKSKEYLRKNLNNYLQIYLKRGDYDEIPFGEPWKFTQARVISFLEKYIDNHDEQDVIVSHAAFMRCFINTINYEFRNKKLDLPNLCIYEIDNPLKNIKFNKYVIAKTAQVYKVSTYDNNYVLKKSSKKISQKDYEINKLLHYLSKNIAVPIPIYMTDKQNYSIKIFDYLEGKHLLGKLSEKDTRNLINEVSRLSELLSNYKTDEFKYKDIISHMFCIKEEINNYKYEAILNKLIDDKELNNYLVNAKYILVHNDLHRYNIIFEGEKISFLDFDGIEVGPEALQLASFIATSFIIEDVKINIEDVIRIWNKNMNKEFNDSLIYKLIIYRLICGINFFNNIKEPNIDDEKLKKKYISGLERMFEYEKYCS